MKGMPKVGVSTNGDVQIRGLRPNAWRVTHEKVARSASRVVRIMNGSGFWSWWQAASSIRTVSGSYRLELVKLSLELRGQLSATTTRSTATPRAQAASAAAHQTAADQTTT